MQIIEYFGLPYSGKSFYTNLCKRYLKNEKLVDSKLIFYQFLLKNKKINKFQYVLLKLKYKFKENINKNKFYSRQTDSINHNKKKIFKKIRRKLFFKNFFKISRENFKLFNLSKKKYSNFYEICIHLIELENLKSRKKDLRRWLVEELNAIFIAKNIESEGILVISEGLVQRIHSYFLNKKELDIEIIKKYIENIPVSDHVFFVKSEVQSIKKRLMHNNKFDKEKFYLDNLDNMNNKMKGIFKLAQAKMLIDIVNDKNSFIECLNRKFFK